MKISDLAIDSKYVDYIDNGSYGYHVYDVELTYQGRNFTTSYMMGSGLTGEPEANDVLWALLADLSTIEEAGDSFEEWCQMLGYNPDSIKDNKTFEDCKVNSAGVKFLLGKDFPKIRKAIDREYN